MSELEFVDKDVNARFLLHLREFLCYVSKNVSKNNQKAWNIEFDNIIEMLRERQFRFMEKTTR